MSHPQRAQGAIPHVIHRMWLNRDGAYDNESTPPEHARYEQYAETWRTHNPTYEFRFWNRRRVEALWEHDALRRWR